MALDPSKILAELDPEAAPLPEPTPESGYRDADMGGIACAFCSKFAQTSHRVDKTENGEEVYVPSGYCSQWEALADGVKVCDKFADGSEPMINHDGSKNPDSELTWTYSDTRATEQFHEIYLSAAPAVEKDGKVIKGILRTGEWDVTPTGAGRLSKPLRIVKEGKSDPVEGVIALNELVENFGPNGPIKRVQIPLSDKKNDDHIKDGNLARVNTGFVDRVWIEDDEEDPNVAHLMGEFNFTEPDVKEKALRGTYADVSAGIPFHISKDGKQYNAVLEHVCITNNPFVDNLKPYLLASDSPVTEDSNVEIVHHILADTSAEQSSEEEAPSVEEHVLVEAGQHALPDRYIDGYDVEVQDGKLIVVNKMSGATWNAPYTTDEDGDPVVTEFKEWEALEDREPVVEQTAPDADTQPVVDVPATGHDELDSARRMRAEALAASAHTITTNGDSHMGQISKEKLNSLGFTDEQRAFVESIVESSEKNEKKARETEVDARVEELKEMGFSDRPSFLKFYREIHLSDDGGPAAILMSDDGGDATEAVSAKDILDRAIDALVDPNKKVVFSDQHTKSDDEKPDASDEKPAVGDRVAKAKQFLYNK